MPAPGPDRTDADPPGYVGHLGALADGTPCPRHELAATDGLTVGVIPLGAIVSDVSVPDGRGGVVGLALGLPTAVDYAERNKPHFGAIVGRYAGRIGGAGFELDGVTHSLSANDGGNCLHGGTRGFSRRVWEVVAAESDRIALRYVSADGEEGFPGTLDTEVSYRVRPGELRIDCRATCDAPTVVNLTNHTYWNLAGEASGSVDDHLLTVVADSVLPCDPTGIPVGDPVAVDGTPLDFRDPAVLGSRAVSGDPAVVAVGGIDHTFVLADAPRPAPELAAILVDPGSGRCLEVWTTEPALQVYTGNDLDGTLTGSGGVAYVRRAGVALEAQHAPDSPNHPTYPTTVLRPGEAFSSTTLFRLEL